MESATIAFASRLSPLGVPSNGENHKSGCLLLGALVIQISFCISYQGERSTCATYVLSTDATYRLESQPQVQG
jgi:hypothetical protein